MRNRTYNIDAVHPVAKRIVKFGLTEDQIQSLIEELTEAGYEPEEMKIEIATEEPLIETADNILDDDEKVLKYMMLNNEMTEKEAMIYLSTVYSAMKQASVVFYSP